MKHEILLTAEQPELVAAVRQAVSRVRNCKLRCVSPSAMLKIHAGPENGPVAWIVHTGRPGMVDQLMEYLEHRSGEGSEIPVLVIGELATPALSRELLRAGVLEYFSRPLDLSRLALTLDLATVSVRCRRKMGSPHPERANQDCRGGQNFVALGPRMIEILRQVDAVSRVRTTVMIRGETGTGKTRLARLIHDRSPRCQEPFVAVNCGALPLSLVESELFGHRKGSFTGAVADYDGKIAAAGGGTLLLDEIDSLPLEVQAKLLRAVDEFIYEPIGANKTCTVAARIVVATNADLPAEVQRGRFRQDLYYRLNVVSFEMPPLREGRAAIRPLAEHFLQEFAQRNLRQPLRIENDAWPYLIAYGWPGNARELRNVMEQLASLTESPVAGLSDLTKALPHLGETPSPDAVAQIEPIVSVDTANLRERRKRAESLIIQSALTKSQNNRSQAARELGISRVALYKKLHQYGLI